MFSVQLSFDVCKGHRLNTQVAPWLVPGGGIENNAGHVRLARGKLSYGVIDGRMFGSPRSFVTRCKVNGGRELATTSLEVCEGDEVRSEFVRKKH